MKRAKYHSPEMVVVSLQPLRETMLMDTSDAFGASGDNLDDAVIVSIEYTDLFNI